MLLGGSLLLILLVQVFEHVLLYLLIFNLLVLLLVRVHPDLSVELVPVELLCDLRFGGILLLLLLGQLILALQDGGPLVIYALPVADGQVALHGGVYLSDTAHST